MVHHKFETISITLPRNSDRTIHIGHNICTVICTSPRNTYHDSANVILIYFLTLHSGIWRKTTTGIYGSKETQVDCLNLT